MWTQLEEKELALQLQESLTTFSRQKRKAVFSWLAMGFFLSGVVTVVKTFPSKVDHGLKTFNPSLSVNTFMVYSIIFSAIAIGYWWYDYRKFCRLSEIEKMAMVREFLRRSEKKICLSCDQVFANPLAVCPQCRGNLIGAASCKWVAG